MPQSAFLVGLAPKFWRSQQNYYIMFYNTVVLARLARESNGSKTVLPCGKTPSVGEVVGQFWRAKMVVASERRSSARAELTWSKF